MYLDFDTFAFFPSQLDSFGILINNKLNRKFLIVDSFHNRRRRFKIRDPIIRLNKVHRSINKITRISRIKVT